MERTGLFSSLVRFFDRLGVAKFGEIGLIRPPAGQSGFNVEEWFKKN